MVTPELEADLLIHSRVHSVAPRMPAASYQMLGTAPAIDTTFDLREETAFRLIRDAFVTLIQPRNRVLRQPVGVFLTQLLALLAQPHKQPFSLRP